jgi:hypothetical protein
VVKVAREVQKDNMAKLKDFLSTLAKKAGFDITSETAKPFFDSLPDTDVPDDVHKGIDNSLISLTAAKDNFPDLKNHYTKQALDGMDKVLSDLLEDFQVDEQTRAEILAEKNTYKRGPMLTRKIVELERKKLSSNSGKDRQEIQKQIDDLQAQLKTTKEQLEAEKKSFEQQRIQDKIQMKKNVLFSGIKTIHDELDPETRSTILDSQIQKALQDNGAKFVIDDQGNFTLLRTDGTNYFGENHQQIKPAQFIESILAKNKQLKVTDSQNGANGTKPQNGSQPTGSGGGSTDNKQSAVVDRNKQALAEFEAASKNGAFGV